MELLRKIFAPGEGPSERQIRRAMRALREILPPEEFHAALRKTLDAIASTYTRWPEAKVVLVQHIPDEAFPLFEQTVLGFLNDDDDDVSIAAIDYLVRHGDEDVRERLIELYLNLESRPRVRGRILDHLSEREWPVKGFRKKMEEAIAEPFYLTAKGTVKRRAL
jgi:hypothetical protein